MMSTPPDISPPNFIPIKSQSINLSMTVLGVDDTILRSCIFCHIYLWLRDGIEFWSWISFIGGGHIIGWRWSKFHWINFELDLRKIESFICYK